MAGPGREVEAGAAERRLAEALRAQASLGARPPAASVVHKPMPPKRGGGQRSGPKPARAGAPGGQSGPHGRSGAAGHQSGPQHATPRPAGAPPPAAGRGAGGPHRPGDDQLPTTKVVTAEPGAEAPTTVAPSAQPGPARPPAAGSAAGAAPPPALAFLDARLRLALVVGLLAGVLLGCALALLSIIDPGLLPAIA